MPSEPSDHALPTRRRAIAAGLLASAAILAGPLACTRATDHRPLLTTIARALFPYSFLDDAAYAQIAARAAPAPLSADADAALVRLEQARSGSPQGAAMPRAALDAFLETGFGARFRAGVLIGLYSDLAIIGRFGYPGPSIGFGGYLNHGFDDIAWLPKPVGATDGGA